MKKIIRILLFLYVFPAHSVTLKNSSDITIKMSVAHENGPLLNYVLRPGDFVDCITFTKLNVGMQYVKMLKVDAFLELSDEEQSKYKKQVESNLKCGSSVFLEHETFGDKTVKIECIGEECVKMGKGCRYGAVVLPQPLSIKHFSYEQARDVKENDLWEFRGSASKGYSLDKEKNSRSPNCKAPAPEPAYDRVIINRSMEGPEEFGFVIGNGTGISVDVDIFWSGDAICKTNRITLLPDVLYVPRSGDCQIREIRTWPTDKNIHPKLDGDVSTDRLDPLSVTSRDIELDNKQKGIWLISIVRKEKKLEIQKVATIAKKR